MHVMSCRFKPPTDENQLSIGYIQTSNFCVEIFQRFRYSLGVFGSSKLYLSVPLLPLISRLRGYYDFDDT